MIYYFLPLFLFSNVVLTQTPDTTPSPLNEISCDESSLAKLLSIHTSAPSTQPLILTPEQQASVQTLLTLYQQERDHYKQEANTTQQQFEQLTTIARQINIKNHELAYMGHEANITRYQMWLYTIIHGCVAATENGTKSPYETYHYLKDGFLHHAANPSTPMTALLKHSIISSINTRFFKADSNTTKNQVQNLLHNYEQASWGNVMQAVSSRTASWLLRTPINPINTWQFEATYMSLDYLHKSTLGKIVTQPTGFNNQSEFVQRYTKYMLSAACAGLTNYGLPIISTSLTSLALTIAMISRPH